MVDLETATDTEIIDFYQHVLEDKKQPKFVRDKYKKLLNNELRKRGLQVK